MSAFRAVCSRWGDTELSGWFRRNDPDAIALQMMDGNLVQAMVLTRRDALNLAAWLVENVENSQ